MSHDINNAPAQKSFIIPVEWSMYSTIRVEADTLEHAVAKAKACIDDIPITDGEYIDGSYTIKDDMEELEIAQDYQDVSDIVIHADGSITT